MFDNGGWEVAPPPGIPQPWELTDDDGWVEELAAADPDRARPLPELLADAECGPVSVGLAAALAAVDPACLGDDDRIALAVAAQRCETHYAAVKARAVAAFAGPPPRADTDAAAFAWTEVSAALSMGEGSARTYVDASRHLCTHLPGTWAAMLAGTITVAKARTLIDATFALSHEQCRQVEDRVLGAAGRRSPSEHSKAVTRAVRAVDPHGWRDRRERKLADVALIRYHHGDGVADLIARHLDSYDAELIWTGADTWARAQKATGDPRTLDALRVAALTDWATRYLTGQPATNTTAGDTDGGEAVPGDTGEPDAGDAVRGDTAAGDGGVRAGRRPVPTRHGQPAVVNVIITLPDLVTGTGEAVLAGTGEPLPAEAVADLLTAGARIRFALTDPNGALVGISTRHHDPTAVMRAWVALRDVTARTPSGSNAPVAGQDLDHIDPTAGTHPANLHAPTRGWHRAKTFRHWTTTANPDGTITWTSQRTGRRHTTYPYNHRAGP